jgi:hypothetical protein
MKSVVTHYFVLSKDGTPRRNVCGYVVTNAKNVVFKPIIMVEITDSRILQHLEN